MTTRYNATILLLLTGIFFGSGAVLCFAKDKNEPTKAIGQSRSVSNEPRYNYTEDPEIAASLQELRSLIDEPLIRWFANLYDPVTGGFYYSESAKTNAGFQTDIESTYSQAAKL